MNYRLAYRIGFHPWEESIDNPDYVSQFTELVGNEEAGRAAPFGRALDIGTGSGIWAVELAKRGWQVSGIDNVELALERARQRISKAGVAVDLVYGDVTRLQEADLEPGFRLVVDTGTYHGLKPAERAAMARGIDNLAAPEASVLMIFWCPRRRPVINIDGVTPEDIANDFPGWEITDIVDARFKLPKLLDTVLKPKERWCRLKRVNA